MPLVVAKDVSSRSLSSLSSTAIPAGIASSSLKKIDEYLTEDVVRGGSTISADEESNSTEAVEAAAADVAAPKEVDVSVVEHDVSAHHSHISRKRRRKKKEKLDGPHSMYAKKLKVCVNCSIPFFFCLYIHSFLLFPLPRIAITLTYGEK